MTHFRGSLRIAVVRERSSMYNPALRSVSCSSSSSPNGSSSFSSTNTSSTNSSSRTNSTRSSTSSNRWGGAQ